MSGTSSPEPLKLAGRYELLRTQATDANTASLLAWDTRLKRWRSIRVARPGDEAASRRMLSVAQWAAKLEHPALERVIDVGTDGTVVYVVRDRLVSSVSDHLRRRGAVAPEWALQVVTRCAEGLAWAHPRGIVHGHPRPDVVQFSEDGSAVLTSFGQRAVLRDTPETRAGADWAHLAPELRQAWQPDATTDVYALGALLYMLLAGKPSADLFYAEAYEGLLSAVPRSLRPLLHRACAFAPAERYTTQALFDALKRSAAAFPVAKGSAPWLESSQEFPDLSQYDGMDAILSEIAPHLDTPQGNIHGEPDSGSLHDDVTVPPGTPVPSGPLRTGPSGPVRTGPSGPLRSTGPSAPPRSVAASVPPPPVRAAPPPMPQYTPPPPPMVSEPPVYAVPEPSGFPDSFEGVIYQDDVGFGDPVPSRGAAVISPSMDRAPVSYGGSGVEPVVTAGQIARMVIGGTLFGALLTVLAAGGYWFMSTQGDRADVAFVAAVQAEEATVSQLVEEDKELTLLWRAFNEAPTEMQASGASSFVHALEDRAAAAPLPVEIEAAVRRLSRAENDWSSYR